MSQEPLGRRAGRGLAWGTLATLVLRFGSLVVGIVLARILSPEDFGVYAIGLAVQGILMTLAELGLSADLVRARDPASREPTVATVSLISGLGMCALMIATAVPVARAFGSEDAAPVISVLSLTLVVSAAGVVPYARLQREFMQKQLFLTSSVDFAVATVVTIVLVVAGLGPMSLAIGRVVAQPCSTGLQFLLTKTVPRFGFDRALARSALSYGVPLSGANLLSMALLNVDKALVGRYLGAVALGYYVLAFNIASWPMTVISQSVRPVALAVFARLGEPGRRATARAAHEPPTRRRVDDDGGLALAVRLTWAVAVPAAMLLGALSVQVVIVVYGERWEPAGVALAALAVFGAFRIVLDLLATYLLARGLSKPVFLIQVIWIAVLVPVGLLGLRWGGLAGVGLAHTVVGVLVVLPAYLAVVRSLGVSYLPVLAAMWRPLVASVPALVTAVGTAGRFTEPAWALTVGGIAGAAVYAALIGPGYLRDLRRTRAWGQRSDSESLSPTRLGGSGAEGVT